MPVLTPAPDAVYTTQAVPKVGMPLYKVPGGEKYRDTRAGDVFPVVPVTVTEAPGSYYVVRVPGNLAGYLAFGSVERWEDIAQPDPDAAYNEGRDAVVAAASAVPRR